MKKKFVSVILLIAICFTMALPAAAIANEENVSYKYIEIPVISSEAELQELLEDSAEQGMQSSGAGLFTFYVNRQNGQNDTECEVVAHWSGTEPVGSIRFRYIQIYSLNVLGDNNGLLGAIGNPNYMIEEKANGLASGSVTLGDVNVPLDEDYVRVNYIEFQLYVLSLAQWASVDDSAYPSHLIRVN